MNSYPIRITIWDCEFEGEYLVDVFLCGSLVLVGLRSKFPAVEVRMKGDLVDYSGR